LKCENSKILIEQIKRNEKRGKIGQS